jgi:hypothetical protein
MTALLSVIHLHRPFATTPAVSSLRRIHVFFNTIGLNFNFSSFVIHHNKINPPPPSFSTHVSSPPTFPKFLPETMPLLEDFRTPTLLNLSYLKNQISTCAFLSPKSPLVRRSPRPLRGWRLQSTCIHLSALTKHLIQLLSNSQETSSLR